MHALSKTLLLSIALSSAACGHAEVPEARRNALLAGDHGWIDLTVHAPLIGPGQVVGGNCIVVFSIDGEPFVNETNALGEADANRLPVAYRFVAPAGPLQADLTITGCIESDAHFKFPVKLDKDRLVAISYDGRQITLKPPTTYEPASLETVQAQTRRLQDDAAGSHSTITLLAWMVALSLLLNIGLLALALARGRVARR